MKLIAIIVILSSCVAYRVPVTGTAQAKLLEVHNLKGGIDSLVLQKMGDGSRMFFMQRNRSVTRARYELQAWYTITYDTTRYQIVNGCRHYEARIKKNQ